MSQTWNPQKVIDMLDKALTTRPIAQRPDLEAALGTLKDKKATVPGEKVTSPQALAKGGAVATKARVKKEAAV